MKEDVFLLDYDPKKLKQAICFVAFAIIDGCGSQGRRWAIPIAYL